MAKREYIEANKEWLAAKAKENGVNALPKGIYYKVLSEGNQDSAKPTVRSIITAHYTGRTIDGKQFDSSRGGVPFACRLCDLIEGWIIAIQQMLMLVDHAKAKVAIHCDYELGKCHLTIFAFCRLSKSFQNSACSSSLKVFEDISLRISSNNCVFVICRSGATSIW